MPLSATPASSERAKKSATVENTAAWTSALLAFAVAAAAEGFPSEPVDRWGKLCENVVSEMT